MMEFTLPHRWQTVLDIVRMDFPDAVIAGGCLRDLILGAEPKDIDIFAQHPERSPLDGYLNTASGIRAWGDRYLGPSRCVINEAFADYCESMDGVVCAIEIDAALTRPLPVQLVTMNAPVTARSASERIDFGLCRVAYDGELFVHPDFQHDKQNMCFTVRRCNNEAQLERSRQRHARFQSKYPGWPMRIPASTVKDEPVMIELVKHRVVYTPPQRPTPERRRELLRLQKELCATNNWPHFAPGNGICWSCNGDTVDERWATGLATGCNLCCRSYCE